MNAHSKREREHIHLVKLDKRNFGILALTRHKFQTSSLELDKFLISGINFISTLYCLFTIVVKYDKELRQIDID